MGSDGPLECDAIRRGRFNHVFFAELVPVVPCLFGGSALAALSLIGSLVIVIGHIIVQIGLHLVNGRIKSLSEGHRVELLLNNLVESFGAAIGLRVTCLGSGVLDIV